MSVKNIWVKNYEIFIENLLKLFGKFNIKYVFIKEEKFSEIHIDGYIFYIHSSSKDKNLNDIINAILYNYNIIILDSMFCNDNINFCFKQDIFSVKEDNMLRGNINFIDDKIKRPGFKRYTKNNIKKDKNVYSINKRSVGAKSPRR